MTNRITRKQKRVAKAIIENSILDKPLNGGEIAEVSGYSKSMQDNPGRVIETPGVNQELINLGFTKENAKTVVSEIMLNKEEDANARLKATDQVFKVEGSYAPEKSIGLNVNVEAHISDPKLKMLSEEFNKKIFEALKDDKSTQ